MLPIVLCAAAAAADTPSLPKYGVDALRPNAWNGVIYAPTPVTASADEARRNRLIALRQEAMDQQARDGGTLTAEHRAYLQQKLDSIQLRYAEIRRRADAFAVDANGRALYSAGTRPLIVTPPEVRTSTRYK